MQLIRNILISAKIKKELKERIVQFLKIAKKHNLCFKQSKSHFDAEEIPILGVVVRQGKVQIENNKVKAIKEQKTPTKIKEVESFLEFTNFYRYFIKNFSHIAKPFNELKGKKDWKQKEGHQKAFKELKEKIISQLILTLFRRKGKFRVETNISEHVIREVLSQKQEGKQKPIEFLSRTIQAAKRNYKI